MKHIDEFCDVTLVSKDGERIRAHKIVLASTSTIFRKILKNYDEKNEDQVISMRGVQSKFINAYYRQLSSAMLLLAVLEAVLSHTKTRSRDKLCTTVSAATH